MNSGLKLLCPPQEVAPKKMMLTLVPSKILPFIFSPHQVKQPKKQKKQTKDIADLGGREPAYQVRDTPVEVQRSYPRTAAEPSGMEYQQRPQYGGQQSYRVSSLNFLHSHFEAR